MLDLQAGVWIRGQEHIRLIKIRCHRRHQVELDRPLSQLRLYRSGGRPDVLAGRVCLVELERLGPRAPAAGAMRVGVRVRGGGRLDVVNIGR